MGTDDEATARAAVAVRLRWAGQALGLGDDALVGATDAEIARLAHGYGLGSLPAAYDEFLRRAGRDNPGLRAVFLDAAVSVDALVPDGADRGGPGLAVDLARGGGRPGRPVVVRARAGCVEIIDGDGPCDPPVLAVDDGGVEVVAPRFTDWLEECVHRAVKRRFPLAEARLES